LLALKNIFLIALGSTAAAECLLNRFPAKMTGSGSGLAESYENCYRPDVFSGMLLRPFIRLLSFLMLAVMGLQASAPSYDVERERGSAFSAATYDVALHVTRRIDTTKAPAVPLPTPPVMRLYVSAEPPIAIEPAIDPYAVEPLLPPILARLRAPRPPPALI
jgi:hypothetical protein